MDWNQQAVSVGLFIAGAGLCMAIGIQDFRTRHVHALLFAGLAAAGILRGIFYLHEVLTYAIVNTCIVAVLVGILWLWNRLFRRAQGKALMLGMGDIAMMEVLGCWFHPAAFVVFFTAATWIVLIAAIVYRKMRKLGPAYPVPFAGGLALLFIPVMAYQFFHCMSCTPEFFKP